MAVDPVCRMTVDEKNAKFTSQYKGTKYFFCAPGCKKSFDADPEKFVNNPGKSGGGCGCGCH